MLILLIAIDSAITAVQILFKYQIVPLSLLIRYFYYITCHIVYTVLISTDNQYLIVLLSGLLVYYNTLIIQLCGIDSIYRDLVITMRLLIADKLAEVFGLLEIYLECKINKTQIDHLNQQILDVDQYQTNTIIKSVVGALVYNKIYNFLGRPINPERSKVLLAQVFRDNKLYKLTTSKYIYMMVNLIYCYSTDIRTTIDQIFSNSTIAYCYYNLHNLILLLVNTLAPSGTFELRIIAVMAIIILIVALGHTRLTWWTLLALILYDQAIMLYMFLILVIPHINKKPIEVLQALLPLTNIKNHCYITVLILLVNYNMLAIVYGNFVILIYQLIISMHQPIQVAQIEDDDLVIVHKDQITDDDYYIVER